MVRYPGVSYRVDIANIHSRFSSSSIKIRYLTSFISGALAVLSLPPFYFWPVLFLVFPMLGFIVDSFNEVADNQTGGDRFFPYFSRKLFIAGWLFGFGYFVFGLYWLGYAFTVESEKFLLLMPLAVLGMPAFLALFYAIAIVPSMWVKPGVSRFFALVTGFGVSEWIRGHILTGFPWNAIGYSLTANEAMLQSASIVGLYGLNFLAVMFFLSPYLLLQRGHGDQRRTMAAAFLIIFVCFSSMVMWGYVRLSTKVGPSFVEGIGLRLVQPNIPQIKKMDPQYMPLNFAELLRISKGPGDAGAFSGTSHVIWPEVAVRALLLQDDYAKQEIAALLPEKVNLITGSLRIEGTEGNLKAYNSLAVFNDKAQLLAVYDKKHLVPFGEYLPLQSFLESLGLEQLTRQRGGFTAGTGARHVSLPGLPSFSPLICYEVIFPNQIAGADKRPMWLLNITNDAWFGNSSGPHQHFHQARVRAVEEGLPVIRVANTGISGVIDGYGAVLRHLEYGVSGYLDIGLPKALPPTLYVHLRGYIFPGFLIAGMLLIVVFRRRDN